MEAQYRQDCIRILLPIEMARKWAGSDQFSLYRTASMVAVPVY
jgi:hypothetical protein